MSDRPAASAARPGPIARLLAEDHRRLDALLDRAAADPDRIDREAYARFREGLLRHIGMEEKVLLPAAARARGGAPLTAARRLRLDHGALAALLVPTPTLVVIEMLRSILGPHDALEEGPDGVYAACDDLLADEVARLLDHLRTFPAVRVAPHRDGPMVEAHVRDAVARARAAWS
jgi:hypothetical protein